MEKGKIRSIIEYSYHKGIIQSLIYHEILLLILAFVYISVPEQLTKPLIISFSKIQDDSFSMEEPVLSLNFNNQSIDDALASSNQQSLLSVEPTLLEIEPENISQSHENTESIKLKDIKSEDLLKKVSGKLKTENTEQLSSNINNRSNAASSTPSDSMSRFRSLLEGGTHLADGIPAEALVAGNGDSGNIVNRLNSYGAQTGDIQVSLIWNTSDDIDLHVNYSNGHQQETIFWRNRYGQSGGILDIDMNARGPQSNSPVENIFWPYNTAPKGQYTIYVHFFRSWTGNTSVPVVVRLKTLKGEMYYNCIAVLNSPAVMVANLSN